MVNAVDPDIFRNVRTVPLTEKQQRMNELSCKRQLAERAQVISDVIISDDCDYDDDEDYDDNLADALTPDEVWSEGGMR